MAVAAQHETVRARYMTLLRHPSWNFPDYDALTELREIAGYWSSAGEHFYAGYVLWSAIHPVWGTDGGVVQCTLEAQREFERVAGRPDLEGIAALRMWITTMGQNYIDLDPSDVRSGVRGLREEMAQRLMQLAQVNPSLTARAGYMVYGFDLTIDFSGRWEPHFPAFEVHSNVIKSGPESITMGIPSAFQNFVRAGDYMAASDIATALPKFLRLTRPARLECGDQRPAGRRSIGRAIHRGCRRVRTRCTRRRNVSTDPPLELDKHRSMGEILSLTIDAGPGRSYTPARERSSAPSYSLPRRHRCRLGKPSS